jgi:hypothetical protein
MEEFPNGHEDSPIKRRALAEIRGALESLRASLEGEGRGEPARPKRRWKSAGTIAAAAALDLLARKISAEPVAPRRRKRGFLKIAVLAAAVLAAGKLIAAKR